MAVIIKNVDVVAHTYAGMYIEPSEQYAIPDNEIVRWQCDTTLSADITSGIAVVNNGIDDIVDVTLASQWLQYPNSRRNLTLRGLILTYSFMDNGLLSGNRWLRHDGSNSASNNAPAIVSFNVQAVGIEFVNESATTSLLIDFYRRRGGNVTLLYTWDVSGNKAAYKTNNMTTQFLPQDEIGVRIRQSGLVLVNNPVVRIHLAVLNEEVGEGSIQ